MRTSDIFGVVLLIFFTLFLPYFLWHIFRMLINPKPGEREPGFIRIVGSVVATVIAIVVGRFLIRIWMAILFHR